MTLKRFWLKTNDQYVQSFVWRDYKFGLNLTPDPEQALSLVSDHTEPGELMVRLFEALTRRPAEKPLPYTDALDAYEVVRRSVELVARPAKDSEQGLPNTTLMVGEARVDYDEFGAGRQLAMNDNRFPDFDASLPERTFHVLGAGNFVDADTGQLYPGMTTQGPDSPLFWALPPQLRTWPDSANALDIFPCDLVMEQEDNGFVNVTVAQSEDDQ